MSPEFDRLERSRASRDGSQRNAYADPKKQRFRFFSPHGLGRMRDRMRQTLGKEGSPGPTESVKPPACAGQPDRQRSHWST